MTKYAPAHKKLVLRLFAEVFKGDVMKTCNYTGIPEHTLRDWLYAVLDLPRLSGEKEIAQVHSNKEQGRKNEQTE